ncbi:MAG: hypothetical protein FJ087_07895 [Deltaproteobacteria bacterium]|nr:hypothetical protein [Deltaproteobacteria bacterium]
MGERLRYDVRIADRRLDNDALCSLSLRTPMVSDIQVAIDRSPDFFAFYDLHGTFAADVTQGQRDSGEAQAMDTYTATVALHEGRVVGVLAAAHRHVLYDGRLIDLAWPMDARVEPEYQRKGVLSAIAANLPGLYPELRLDCIMGVVLRGNVRALNASREAAPEHFVGRPAGAFHLVQFMMYRPYRERRGLVVETARPEDLDEVTDLLARFHEGHNFQPRMDRAWMDELLRRTPDYSVSDLSLVREGGRIVAAVGLWDQGAIRRLIMQRNPWKVRLGLLAAGAIHLVLPSPPPPRVGEPLRSLYLKHVACAPGHEGTLCDLMRVVLNRARRGRRHHFVWGAFYQSSPLLPLWKGFSATRSYSQVVYAPWNTGWDATPEQVGARPMYLDFSMV